MGAAEAADMLLAGVSLPITGVSQGSTRIS